MWTTTVRSAWTSAATWPTRTASACGTRPPAVRAVPVDYMVPGYASGRVNTLRLWTAKSYDEFDLLTFNRSDYLNAVRPQVDAENIS